MLDGSASVDEDDITELPTRFEYARAKIHGGAVRTVGGAHIMIYNLCDHPCSRTDAV